MEELVINTVDGFISTGIGFLLYNALINLFI